MARSFWLVKQEPEAYSWDDFVRDGRTHWDGVRNYQARNNLREMKVGDLAFFYHSVKEKRIVGVATIVKEAYPDPTAEEGDWSVVDLEPLKPMEAPVSLADIKADPVLCEMPFVKQSRLSVAPVTRDQFKAALKLGKTKISGV